MAIDGDPQSSTSLPSSAELTVNRCYFKNTSNNRVDASWRGASGTDFNGADSVGKFKSCGVQKERKLIPVRNLVHSTLSLCMIATLTM